jgi:hypothetical protein
MPHSLHFINIEMGIYGRVTSRRQSLVFGQIVNRLQQVFTNLQTRIRLLLAVVWDHNRGVL